MVENIKIHLKYMVCERVDCILLDKYRNQLLTLLNTVINY